MKKRVWIPLVILALLVIPLVSTWGQETEPQDHMLRINQTLVSLAIQTMEAGAEKFASLLKEYSVTLDMENTHFLFGEGEVCLITEAVYPEKIPGTLPERVLLGLMFVSRSNEYELAPGWYAIGTYPTEESTEWRSFFMDAKGDEVYEYIAIVRGVDDGQCFGVRGWKCLSIKFGWWHWWHRWYYHWGTWRYCPWP